MNKKRAATAEKALRTIAEALQTMLDAAEELQGIHDELEDQFSAMSEKAQEGDRGQELSDEISNLSEIIEAIAAIDVAREIGDAARNLDLEAPDFPAAKIDAKTLADKRMARLPQWARIMLDQAIARQKEAEKTVLSAFGEPSGKPEEFTLWKHASGNLGGKVIPGRIIEVPSIGLRLEVARMGRDFETREERWGLSIHAGRDLAIHPSASNVVYVTGRKD